MTTKEFNKRLNEGIKAVETYMVEEAGTSYESVKDWCGTPLANPLQYGAQSQYCQELRLADNGHKREFTFMNDLSIAEWYGVVAVVDTVSRIMRENKNNERAMAEFVLSVNWKAWEMNARHKRTWAIFYSQLYYVVRDLVYDYYENNEEKVAYVYDYLD